MVAPPLPFGRFAAIDSVVAEGQQRMAKHKKSQIIFGDEEEQRPTKAHSKKPSAAYSTEYQRSFSNEERYEYPLSDSVTPPGYFIYLSASSFVL